MRSRVRIQPYVPRELASRLRAYAAAQGVPDGAVIASALREYLDRDRNDRELLMRRLDRNTVGISEARRDIAIVAEALGTFARAWFVASQGNRASTDGEAARRQARSLYEQFVQRVAGCCMTGDGLMGRVLAELGPGATDD
jgi:hypothetical protein